MTVATPPRVHSARDRRARLAVIGAGLVVAIAAMIAPAAPSFATTTPTPSPSPSLPPGEAVFTLAPVGNGIVIPGDALNVSVTMQNGTDAATGAGTVSLRLGEDALASRARLSSWLAGETDGVTVTEIASAVMDGVQPAAELTNGLAVTSDHAVLTGLTPGVYPLVATLTTSSRTFVSTSAVIVPADDAESVGIGVVVPITAPATAEGLLTSALLAELTAPAGALTIQLDAVDGTDAILAVDPAIPAAIRVLGTAAPQTALDWLTRLETLVNSRFALQFGDADVAAQIQAGISPPLRPTSLQAFMSPTDFVPEVEEPGEATPSPTPSVDPLAPVYPNLSTLLGIGGGRAGVFWPAAGTGGGDVVEVLGSLTVDAQSGLTMIPSDMTAEGADGATVAARGSAGDAGALVYDAAVSEQLHEASLKDESAIRGAHLTAATAYLAFAVGETGGSPLLVTLDRDQDRSRVGMRTAITSALGAPGVRPTTLGGIANSPSQPVEVGAAAADEVRVAAASGLTSDEAALARFSTVLDEPSLLTGPERAEILQLLGNAWLGTPELWAAALAEHRATTTTTLDSVGVVPPSDIQLISSGAGIPVWVRNDLPYPVTVHLLASPDDLRLEVQDTTVVTASPQNNTRAEVPVQAQIGNGDVTLTFTLQSPVGVPIGDPQTAEVHVRADWEGIGIVILAVLGGGLVLLGLLRTVQRRRRASRTAAEAQAGEAESGAAEGHVAADPAPTAEEPRQ